ncbi:phenylacetate-CoA ligase [Jejuia pallidilutea]|uniref:Phenylacetate-CoA ligase n=1 Tax=Jejuia pallidilutea TaxID=504487 RepID=A0A362X1Q1_9FLAO|nr:phenylacetate--CoA ligase family protein [Jejuia pallidilutea]PQV50145.1 phenylacetate-CoA ligase [Jejuia pallidilutea]
MHFGTRVRNTAFWTLDYLKGGKIKTNLKDIEHSLNNLSFEALKAKNKKVLNVLLDTAVTRSIFYSKYKGYKNLRDFPVLNKGDIKAQFNSITLQELNKEDLNKVSTSGSTGTPFSIYQSKLKQIRNTADTLYFAKDSGFTLGEKLLYLRLWSKYYRKNRIIAYLQNIEQIHIEDLDDAGIKRLLNKLERTKVPMGWLGYASGFEKICKYLEKNNAAKIDCKINSAIAMSEAITDVVKQKMDFYFNCSTVSRYSNVENGIIAQQTKNSNNFKINWASYIVEVLEMHSDNPAKKGELGRIVITDLYNLSTPMIRYDTGDVGVLGECNTNNDFPVLKTIHGRISDMLIDTSGNVISPFVVHTTLYEYSELEQFQIIQNGKKDYILKINCINNKFTKEAHFLKFFKNVLGEDANLKIEYVKEIPVLKSGKRKIVVNNFNKV